MNNAKHKEWLSLDDQIKLLKERGMQFDNEKDAKLKLANIGYYRLSGYWYPFRSNPQQNDKFKNDTSFSDVMNIYVFDQKLKLLVIEAIERIEISLRTWISYVLGKHDGLAHRKKEFIHSPSYERWLREYDKNRTSINSKRNHKFIEHYNGKHSDGTMEIWVSVNIWTFGQLSRFFSFLYRKYQNEIAEKYNITKGEILAQLIKGLNIIRNFASHHDRLWNRHVASAKLKQNFLKLLNIPAGIKPDRIFYYIFVMQLMLREISPKSSWLNRINGLISKEFPNKLLLADFGVEQQDYDKTIKEIEEQ